MTLKEKEEYLCKLCGVDNIYEVIYHIGSAADEILIVDEIKMKGDKNNDTERT